MTTDPSAAYAAWCQAMGEALVPGAESFERIFGGLFDAFGLRPVRELEQAWREMLVAGAEQQRAQMEYLGLVTQACNDGTHAFVRELQDRAARGDAIESVVAFARAWAQALDGPLHDTMQSERGLQATAKVVRAAVAYRGRMQKALGLASDTLQLPTRTEVDDAYREIQDLKRELRRLRKRQPGGVSAQWVVAEGRA